MGVSVLMSIYEKEHPEYFRIALESILFQTMPADEICIMVDGPLTDELESVLEKYLNIYPIIKVHRFKQQVMLGESLKKGVEICSNELIARMDTDDFAKNDRLEKQYSFMISHPDIDVLGGNIEEFHNDGKQMLKNMPLGNNEISKYSKYRNPINHMTVMFRKTAVLNAGNYRHRPFMEDYDLWIRMLYNGSRFNNLPDTLVNVRVGEVYSRRSGWGYFKTHLGIRNMQIKFKMLNCLEYIIAILLSMGFAMQPLRTRALTHKALRLYGK